MDMETLAHIRARSEIAQTGYSPLWFIIIGACVLAFWGWAIWNGYSPAASAAARAIQWLGQPLAEVIR